MGNSSAGFVERKHKLYGSDNIFCTSDECKILLNDMNSSKIIMSGIMIFVTKKIYNDILYSQCEKSENDQIRLIEISYKEIFFLEHLRQMFVVHTSNRGVAEKRENRITSTT